LISRWTMVNLLLAAIAGLLAVQIGRTWTRTAPALRAPASGDASPHRDAKPKAQPARANEAEEDVASITSLDLFDQTRQAPGVVTDVAVPVEASPPTGIDVVGIRSIGGDQEAFIRDGSQGNTQRRVRMGDEVAGYTVQSIDATDVKLGNTSGGTVTLYLQLALSGNPGAVVSVPGRPAPAGTPPTVAPPASAPGQASRTPPMDPASVAMQQRIEERWDKRRLQLQQQGQPSAHVPPSGSHQHSGRQLTAASRSR
jgi:hypothetical protein